MLRRRLSFLLALPLIFRCAYCWAPLGGLLLAFDVRRRFCPATKSASGCRRVE